MTARDHLDRQLDDFLLDGPTELPEASLNAVRGRTDKTRQRVGFGPWRMPDIMNKLVPIGIGAAAVVVAVVIGTQLLGPAAPGAVGGAPSAEPAAPSSPTPLGGTVKYQKDGASTTTEVDAVADGASVSGTAITSSVTGTHTVALECAVRDGDTWAFGGTTEETTVPGELPGLWSAVVVKDGSPQRIGIWLSDDKSEGIDCAGWLGALGISNIDAENFVPVESGELVPPPDLAP